MEIELNTIKDALLKERALRLDVEGQVTSSAFNAFSDPSYDSCMLSTSCLVIYHYIAKPFLHCIDIH